MGLHLTLLMEQFYLNPKSLYAVLKAKGITSLYHCNTVLTSLTFIEQRALLSRAYVERHGLIQTPQNSDAEDVAYNVWDDVFMDGIDLHKKYNRLNKYGPVLFVMKLEVLVMPELCPVLVTRANPWYWKNFPKWEQRYYDNTEEIAEKYLTGKILDSSLMFTFRAPEKTIKLNKFLTEIVVDKPRININRETGKVNVGIAVHDKLTETLKANGLGNIPIRFRHEEEKFSFCTCHWRYPLLPVKDLPEFQKRFRGRL